MINIKVGNLPAIAARLLEDQPKPCINNFSRDTKDFFTSYILSSIPPHSVLNPYLQHRLNHYEQLNLQPLCTFNGRSNAQDAFISLLDAALYLLTELEERRQKYGSISKELTLSHTTGQILFALQNLLSKLTAETP